MSTSERPIVEILAADVVAVAGVPVRVVAANATAAGTARVDEVSRNGSMVIASRIG